MGISSNSPINTTTERVETPVEAPRKCGMSWLADMIETAIQKEMQETGETREQVGKRFIQLMTKREEGR